MGLFDIILISLLGLGFYKGYKQGFVLEFFSFVAFFLGLFLALELTIPISLRLFGSSSFFDLGAILTFILLFVLLSLLIKMLAKAIKNMVDLTFLGTLDNVLGAFAGLFKTAFILSVIIWVFDSVGFEMQGYVDNTLVLPYIVNIGPTVFEWVGILIPIIRDLIDSLEQLPSRSDSVLTYLIV